MIALYNSALLLECITMRAGKQFHSVTSFRGQLSLAIPAVSTSNKHPMQCTYLVFVVLHTAV